MIDSTQVFSQIEQGDLSDADQLLPLTYGEVHTSAYSWILELAENKDDTTISRVGSSGECPGPRGIRSPGGRGKIPTPELASALSPAAAVANRRGEVYDDAIVHRRL